MPPNSPPPIQSLPTEILSNILVLVINPTLGLQGGIHEPFSSLHNSLSRLGSVCRTWRDISMSTPALWSYIRVDLQDGPHSVPNLRRAQEFLERSKAFPLTVILNVVAFDEVGFLKRLSQGEEISWAPLDLILGHAERIRHLHILSDDDAIETFSTRLIPHFSARFINLEDLRINVADANPFIVAEAFTHSPLLHRITIYHTNDVIPSFSTHHLTHIVIDDEVELLEFPKILTQLPLLESVAIKIYDGRFREEFSIPALPRIRTFEITLFGDNHYFDMEGFTDLIKKLHFPSLTSLALHMPIFDNRAYGYQPHTRAEQAAFIASVEDFVAAFKTFLGRSPDIETFRLTSRYLDDRDVLAFLRLMPKLTSLAIVDENISAHNGWTRIPLMTLGFLLELEIGQDVPNKVLVPKLRDLRLEVPRYDYYGSRWTALEDMLKSRVRDGPRDRLWSVYLRLVANEEKGIDLGCFRRLQVAGLAIRVVNNESEELLGYSS